MAIEAFPPVESADSNGIVGVGGDLEIASLLLAYTSGIFPWPISKEYPLAWFSPDPRGILEYKDLIIHKSLQKLINQKKFEIKFNHDFESVIRLCSSVENRKDQNDTWITEEMIAAYINLHQQGYAISAEAYSDNTLVGGLYCVKIGKIVSGESMFYRQSNASKVALVALMDKLHQEEIEWIDTQMVTPIIESLGGKEIPRKVYLKKLMNVQGL